MTKAGALMVTTPSDREILMTRLFDAPRRLVFDAFTKPDLVRRWLLGPDGWTMPVCEIDLKVGGRYRYVWRNETSGKEMATGGVFRDIVPPERLVNTEKFEDAWYPGEAIVTTTFEEQGGRTTVRQSMLLDSREIRDGILKSGMESGVERSYERLEEQLAEQEAKH
jgi:uncharacterized protein YndB with AHSA1/START domain